MWAVIFRYRPLDCLGAGLPVQKLHIIRLAERELMWKLQDAKNRFSAAVEAALGGEPQHVTRRGKPAVVVTGNIRHFKPAGVAVLDPF